METPTISFTVFGKPQQKGSKQPFVNTKKDGSSFAGMKDMNPKARGWQHAVTAAAASEYRGELLTGPVQLSAVFYFARPASHMGTGRNAAELKPSAPAHHGQTPDLDKLLRVIADGLEGAVVKNDKQICQYGEAARRWTLGQARAELVIEPLTEADAERIESYRAAPMPF
jgi:Holliday junction resolvase RusA-like endonuclease